jgi:uncharacterized protein YjbI with pentapeptide repeats
MEKKSILKFECKEEALTNNSSYCLFHDEKYYQSHAEEVAKRLFDKFNEHIDNNAANKEHQTPLKCIGYHIPQIIVENGIHFPYIVYFTKSKFHGTVIFHDVTFQIVNFAEAEFQEEATFSFVTFFKFTTFGGAQFLKRIEFRKFNFQEVVVFRESWFQNAKFIIGEFAKNFEADFQNSTFKEMAFFRIGLHGVTDFSDSTFGIVSFRDVTFGKETLFYRLLVENQESILFDVEDMSNVSFLGTDISRVRFGEKVIWGDRKKERFKILEEKRLEQSVYPLFSWADIPGKGEDKLKTFLQSELDIAWINPDTKTEKSRDGKTINVLSSNPNDTISVMLIESAPTVAKLNINGIFKYAFSVKHGKNLLKRTKLNIHTYTGVRLESVLTIYRNLRENYEYNLRYDQAGEFFVREMELKRRYKESFIEGSYEAEEKDAFSRRISPYGIYYVLCKYGENYRRPMILSAGILSISTMYFSIKNNPSFFISSQIDMNVVADSLQKSVMLFLPLGPINNWEGIIIRIVGSLILGLMFLALRRKFERRFRH